MCNSRQERDFFTLFHTLLHLVFKIYIFKKSLCSKVLKKLSKFLVTIKTRGVEKILASFNFLLPLFLLIHLEAFFQEL